MPNPYVVIGGIAVGVVVAAFGIFAVPGWVEMAQDSNAQRDLGNIRDAQVNQYTLNKSYGADLASFEKDSDWGIDFNLSDGIKDYELTTSKNFQKWCASIQSASGRWFATTGENTAIASGKTSEEALANAGCDLSEPVIPVVPIITAAYTLNCPTTTEVRVPIGGARGTLDWGDGTIVEAAADGELPAHTLTGGQEYKITFTGTFDNLNTTTFNETGAMTYRVLDAARLCYRSMDLWDERSGTTDASYAFGGMRNLTKVPGNLPSTVDSLVAAFDIATSFNDNAITTWNVGNVRHFDAMFSYATQFNQDIGHWDVGRATTMNAMFAEARKFNQPLNDWNVSQVTDFGRMFRMATSFNQDLDHWKTSSAIRMEDMFWQAAAFNGNVTTWDTRNVIRMDTMFAGATTFNQPIGGWDVSNLQNSALMFTNAVRFNQPLNDWDMGAVRDMSWMFQGAAQFDQPLDKWDTSAATTMASMFSAASAFNRDISMWDTSKVTTMESMFAGAKKFNAPVQKWNIRSVTAMENMFANTDAFNQPVGSWDVSKVRTFYYMFLNAKAFDQDVSNWTNVKADPQVKDRSWFANLLATSKLPANLR
jgi:surface protein